MLPEWFSWVDICARLLLIVNMSYEMVQFEKYWKNLMDTIRLAEQIKVMQRQAETMREPPVLKNTKVNVDDGMMSVWE
jgi:hypothetical protein